VARRLPEGRLDLCRGEPPQRLERSGLAAFEDPNRTLSGLTRPETARPFLLIVLAVGACERGGAISTQRDSTKGPNGEALAATIGLTRQAVPYTARPLDAFGALAGSVEIDGLPPADTVIQPPPDQLECGAFTRRGIERNGNRAVGVVVWIDGLRSGKALPIDRRFEIVNDRCLLVPEVQTSIAGGTLNVRNVDATEHHTRITRRDGGDVLATIRETDEGQVVPNERVLSKAGVLHLTCDLHAWTHAWIAVFDHPYFATTGVYGSFTIDSVPPGRYQLHAWHPRLGMIADSVTVVAGQTSSIALRAKAASR
jgi:Polysaccharide lyase family 4, domain II